MKNFIVCIQGQGTGCDYTIDCNKTFDEMQAESIDDLINKIHIENNGNGGDVYMSNCGDDDDHGTVCGYTYDEHYDEHRTYLRVYAVEGEFVDISKQLREKIRASQEIYIEKEKAETQDAEYRHYLELKKKFEK